MTPKEKANELVCKFQSGYKNSDGFNYSLQNDYEDAKQCALIAVEEILELNVAWYDEKLVEDYPSSYKNYQTIEYWERVKKEIEKI